MDIDVVLQLHVAYDCVCVKPAGRTSGLQGEHKACRKDVRPTGRTSGLQEVRQAHRKDVRPAGRTSGLQ